MTIKTFRLTPEALANLERIASDYKIAPNKIINILLTTNETDPLLDNTTAAAHVIEKYFSDLLTFKHS